MLKYQKISSTNIKKKKKKKKKCIIQKDQMLWFMKKPNEKFLSFVIILLWEAIYVHFYNWDKSLDLVLVVYNLIELIIETSL